MWVYLYVCQQCLDGGQAVGADVGGGEAGGQCLSR